MHPKTETTGETKEHGQYCKYNRRNITKRSRNIPETEKKHDPLS